MNRTHADEERLLAAPLPLTRAIAPYAIATLAGSTLWLWPHLVHFRQVPDRGDPIFSAWRLARLAHQLATDPRHLFDGNIFYPLPLTLTYSDATILQGLLGAPLIWLGVEPLIVSNLLFFLAFPACGLAFFYVAWQLTGDPKTAVVAGLLGAWYPFHSEHYSHLELQWFMFVPLALLAALRLLARPTLRTGLTLGVAVSAQWLASMYIGLMLMTVLVPFALATAVGWRVRPSRALIRSWLASIVVVLTVCVLTGLPYVKSRPARGDRTIEQLWPGSATVSDYAATHRRLASYRWHARGANQPERELFPGASPLFLGTIGALTFGGAVPIAMTLAGALAFDGSLGLNGLTYRGLYDLGLPYRGLRVPARFSVLFGSCLILLGAFGAHVITRRGGTGTRNALFLIIVGLVLLDLRVTTPLVDYWPTAPTIYQQVRSDMVLAEFPAGHDVDYMYFSTTHWARLIGGYTGFLPADPEFDRARDTFPSPESLAWLRLRGATHLTYNCMFERSPERCVDTLQRLDRSPSLRLVAAATWYGSDVRLYRFH